ncbi:basal cell adhesion molecule [Platysternon megacephalum]|uniref:Basal cell adhesion molecule n=1 Tax=Platysternon megacephalum TaxID=55544 RepID=A0A4D9DP08_9SAUR|nr:basal cell adhesion molecule [Platysternon megacephalum]
MSRTLLVSALLLVLVEAFAEGAPAKNCKLSQYKSLVCQYSQCSQAFRDFRDKYDEMFQDPAADCSARIFRRKLDELSECQNLLVLEKKVDLTIRVIQNLSEPELVRNASEPLKILASIREDLRSCIQLKGLDNHPAARMPILVKQLQEPHAGKSEGSARCLERGVIFNLVRLLNDLQNVAYKFNKACH